MSKVGAHVEAILAAVGTGGGADSPEARAGAAVLAVSTIGRRGVMTYKMHNAVDNDGALYLIEEDLLPHGATVITAAESGFLLLTPDEKNHPVAHPIHGSATSTLLEHVCSSLENGEYVFTPKSVGVNSEKLSFDSSSFSSFFQRLTLASIGVRVSPKDVRKMRATNAVATNVPFAIQQSVAAGMATSVKQLRHHYSAASLLDESWLGSQIARYQFDQCFAVGSQTVVVPVSSPLSESTVDYVPARLVRAEGNASVLLALFVEVSPNLFEMSNRVIRAPSANLQVTCSLKADPASGSQYWRARDFSTQKAKIFFEREGQVASWLSSVAPIDTFAGSPAFGQLGDLVLCLKRFTLSEIKKVLPNGDLELHLATEIENAGLPRQAVFEFQHSKETVQACPSDVVWPLDLKFDVSGRFTLSKGSRLPCV